MYSFGRGGQLVPHGAHTLTVGILNLTPDSFSTAPGEHLVASAGTGLDLDRVEGLARSMLDQGYVPSSSGHFAEWALLHRPLPAV